MFRAAFSRLPSAEWLLCTFLLFSVLWRGGKSLEATWILVGAAGMLTVLDALQAGRFQRPETKYQKESGIRLLAFGFFTWTLLSYLFSTTQNYGLDELLRDGALILIFLWTLRHCAGEAGARFLHRFTHTIAVAATLGTFLGVLVYALQPVNRFVGTFFDYRFHTDYWPNAWAQFVLLSWPVVALWTRERMGWLRVAGCGLLGIVLGTLLLSYSRGAMIAFGGQVMLLGMWELIQRKGDGQQMWKIIAVKIVVTAITAVVVFSLVNAVRGTFHPVQSVGEKITFTADEGGSSVDERTLFWKQSLQMITERPLLGWGPYSFRFVQQRYQTGVLQTSDHPHNIFLKIAAERGITAMLLFFILISVTLYPVGRTFIRLFVYSFIRVNDPTNTRVSELLPDPKAAFIFIAVAGVLAHNLIDYNLQFVGIALPFWMMLGVLASESGKWEAEGGKFLSIKIVQNTELCIAIILLTVALREGVFLVTSSLGRHAESRGQTDKALLWYDRSSPEWFSRDMHLSRALLSTAEEDTATAHDAMAKLLSANAEDPRGWRLLGDIAYAQGDLSAARKAYAKAYALGRWNDLSITLALAETLVESEQSEDRNEPASLAAIKPEVDALLGAFVEAIVRNEHFVALSHNAEDAVALAALLAETFPDFAPRYEVLAARADFAMKTERAKVKSRPAGYLW